MTDRLRGILVCELDWIDLLVDSDPREPISTLFLGRHEVGVSVYEQDP
jgi:hypothetical protein